MNQREIAKHLGVSQTAVSMVINNPYTEKISPLKREGIINFLKECDYKCKLRNKTGVIGYLLPERLSGFEYRVFYDRFITGIEEAAANAHYNVIIEKYRGNRPFANNKVDGIILQSGVCKNRIREIVSGSPSVLLNTYIGEGICDAVCSDNLGGLELAVRHLIERGHSSIAYFAPRSSQTESDSNALERLDGFYIACRKFGVVVEDGLVQIPVLRESSMKATEELLISTLTRWSGMPNKPTAVICCNDFYALSMVRQARRLGISIPDRLSIVGSDNVPAGELSCPMLTSIDHNPEEMGHLAIEMLMKRINEPQRPVCRISCRAVLHIRESVALKS